MPKRRTPGVNYRQATIEDRPDDNDVNIEGVDSGVEFTVNDNEANKVRSLEVISVLGSILHEIKKTNLYLAEMLGDEFDDY